MFINDKSKFNENRPNASVYTDGSCIAMNEGLGGWAAVIIHHKSKDDNPKKYVSGNTKKTTSSRMEMTAVIRGIKELKIPCNITVYTDSGFIYQAFNKNWITKWRSNGWRASRGTVKNLDLWMEINKLLSIHNIIFKKVKAHSGNTYNEQVDTLAQKESQKLLKI